MIFFYLLLLSSFRKIAFDISCKLPSAETITDNSRWQTDYIVLVIFFKKDFDITCESSPVEIMYIECQGIFFLSKIQLTLIISTSRITAYLEVEIRSLPKHENLITGKIILWKRGEISPISTIFSTCLRLQESNYIYIC